MRGLFPSLTASPTLGSSRAKVTHAESVLSPRGDASCSPRAPSKAKLIIFCETIALPGASINHGAPLRHEERASERANGERESPRFTRTPINTSSTQPLPELNYLVNFSSAKVTNEWRAGRNELFLRPSKSRSFRAIWTSCCHPCSRGALLNPSTNSTPQQHSINISLFVTALYRVRYIGYASDKLWGKRGAGAQREGTTYVYVFFYVVRGRCKWRRMRRRIQELN